MECFLLWLDDLDDLVFVAAVSWRSASRVGLSAGFVAALMLMPSYGADLGASWAVALGGVAAGSVVAWLTAAVPLVGRPLRRSFQPA